MKDFASAVSSLDAQKAEALFLVPDSTPDGTNRQAHIQEMRKDWTRVAAQGKKMTANFTNTVILVRTQMKGEESTGQPMEFKVAFTKEGLKIVAMK